VMLVHMVGTIDANDVLAYLERSFEMRDQANEVNGVNGPLVHTISDTSAITQQNIDLKTAQKIMKSLKSQKIGWSLYVSTDRVQIFFSSLAHQFGGIRFKPFSTIEDALDFLREANDQLDEALGSDYELGIIESARVEGT
ncbi:MAG: hypothetical protein AAFQ52_12915, partial [Chloroflexota bacterium]